VTDTSKFKARPTVYKGVKMRSRLEAGFAQWLDGRIINWEYEPCAFGSAGGQYLPDFRLNGLTCLWRGEPVTVYVEVKPKGWPYWAQESSYEDHEGLLARMAIIWESEPGAELVIAQPGRAVRLGDEDDTVSLVTVLDQDPFTEDPTAMPADAMWVWTPGGMTGLGRPLPGPAGPWPDGYWKGPQ
jgi:hypothetical protein